jgi:hypothetical protein
MDEYIDAFAHGPVVSKLWLCEELEKILDSLNYKNPTVNILGGWINVLGFMLQVRKVNYYKEINSYDMDDESTRFSNQLCDAWKYENSKINNITIDVNNLQFEHTDESVFVNCSIDQFNSVDWYNNIPDNSIVCLQTTTIPIENAPWKISQETKDMNDLLLKYKISNVLYTGERSLPLHDRSFTRLMAIGVK